jgi:hypothetical protein|tara:strand:- start:982 stop:1101 length:120 start_codon:yes stop_codon:yes gene_type:complete
MVSVVREESKEQNDQQDVSESESNLPPIQNHQIKKDPVL